MRLFYVLLFIGLTQSSKAQTQVFDLSVGQRILTTDVTLSSAKKLLEGKYNFLLTGDTSYSGNVNWAFESKDANKYELILLYSTAFNKVTYIQFFDNINQVSSYKKLIEKMGYTSQGVKYAMGGAIAKYGYRKNNLLFVIELGSVPGRCKLHFSKLED